jgi:N utilization substance protein B
MPIARRTRVREVVLQILYQDDVNPTADAGETDRFVRERLKHDPISLEFAYSLLGGVRRNREELDALLSNAAENWTLARMAVTDRNILRMGAFEILYTSTPQRVAINEAVELAKRYGARQSPQFVNGLLDRLLREVKKDST